MHKVNNTKESLFPSTNLNILLFFMVVIVKVKKSAGT